jgi:superfamily II helicase
VTSKHAYLSSAGYTTPLPTLPALLTQEEMVARIEAARLEDAPPLCPTCGSTTPKASRRCYHCAQTKPLTAFAKESNKPHGRSYLCKRCKRERGVVAYTEQRRQQFREILGRPG